MPNTPAKLIKYCESIEKDIYRPAELPLPKSKLGQTEFGPGDLEIIAKGHEINPEDIELRHGVLRIAYESTDSVNPNRRHYMSALKGAAEKIGKMGIPYFTLGGIYLERLEKNNLRPGSLSKIYDGYKFTIVVLANLFIDTNHSSSKNDSD